ncbi:MAG: DNA-processing protein DprA, partial [Anaerovoracaceae bacterium]
MDNVKRITCNDTNFPEVLKIIKQAPKELYYKGDISLLKKKSVAVVGTRMPTPYGTRVARNLGAKLSRNGVVVVSGLAMGIDCCSHQGALDETGETIAVLGCGIDCKPATSTIKIRKEIEERGLIISEYPPLYPVSPGSFPARNRIISGLAEATVIVEAATKSGSLITADRAMEQGKEVFAIPGNINSKSSMGTNKLIAEGANILHVLDDIFDFLSVKRIDQQLVKNNLGQDELTVYNVISQRGEATIDEICVLVNQ